MIITNFKQLEPFRKKVGIYRFTLKKDSTRNYVGKSVTLYRRIASDHKIANGKHYIDYVIKDLGGLLENFDIELVHWWDEPVDKWEVLNLETACIDFYDCLVEKGGYNICLFSNDRTGMKMSKESCEKMSQGQKRLYQNGYISPNIGIIRSEETKEKCKETWKEKMENGYISYNKGKPGLAGENNPFFGQKHTLETRQKISDALQDRDFSYLEIKIKQIDLKTGEVVKIWDSIKEASIGLVGNESYKGNICSALKGRRNYAYGYKWEYV